MKRFFIIAFSLIVLLPFKTSAQIGGGFAIDDTGILDARTGKLVKDPSQFERVMKSNMEYYEEQNRQANNSQPAQTTAPTPPPAAEPAPPAPAPAPSSQEYAGGEVPAQTYEAPGYQPSAPNQYAVQEQQNASSDSDTILLVGGGLLLFALFAIIILLIFLLLRKKEK